MKLLKYTTHLLSALILILLLTSCCNKQQLIVKPQCYIPKRVVLEECKKEVVDIDCVKVLVNNINLLMSYSQELETTVRCYDNSYKVLEK